MRKGRLTTGGIWPSGLLTGWMSKWGIWPAAGRLTGRAFDCSLHLFTTKVNRGAEFAGPENDQKIFNNCKMQDPENDGPRARCMPRIHRTGVLFKSSELMLSRVQLSIRQHGRCRQDQAWYWDSDYATFKTTCESSRALRDTTTTRTPGCSFLMQSATVWVLTPRLSWWRPKMTVTGTLMPLVVSAQLSEGPLVLSSSC